MFLCRCFSLGSNKDDGKSQNIDATDSETDPNLQQPGAWKRPWGRHGRASGCLPGFSTNFVSGLGMIPDPACLGCVFLLKDEGSKSFKIPVLRVFASFMTHQIQTFPACDEVPP